MTPLSGRNYDARMFRSITASAALLLCISCASEPSGPDESRTISPEEARAGGPGGGGAGGTGIGAIRGDGGIAGRINNEIITWKDVDDTLKKMPPSQVNDDMRRAKLRSLAEERLYLQAAKQNNISVSEQELDDDYRRKVKEYASEDDFLGNIRRSGITFTEYREDRRRLILIHKLYRHLIQSSWMKPGESKGPGILIDQVTPEEIKKHYEENKGKFKSIEQAWVLRIAFQCPTDSERDEKRRLAESLVRQLDEGSDFTLLAFFNSDVQRHLMGVDRASMRKDFTPETVALLFDTLKPGEVSAIVVDGPTLNLFKVERRMKQSEETFEEAQLKIRSELEALRREENRRKLRDHLIKFAYISPEGLIGKE